MSFDLPTIKSKKGNIATAVTDNITLLLQRGRILTAARCSVNGLPSSSRMPGVFGRLSILHDGSEFFLLDYGWIKETLDGFIMPTLGWTGRLPVPESEDSSNVSLDARIANNTGNTVQVVVDASYEPG